MDGDLRRGAMEYTVLGVMVPSDAWLAKSRSLEDLAIVAVAVSQDMDRAGAGNGAEYG